MVISKNKEGVERMLIYEKSVLALNKEDSLIFKIKNDNLYYFIEFKFSEKGEDYTTQFWHSPQDHTLVFQLNNWDSSTYVEISDPFLLNEGNLGDEPKIFMKFRNYSLKNKNQRKFELSIWKETRNESK